MALLSTIIIGFCIISFILFFVFLCLCIGSLLGVLKLITPFLIRLLSANHDKKYAKETQPINKECFICLQSISNQIVTTCDHSFCGECIIKYIQSNVNNQINCPACRKQILVLFRRFQPTNDEQQNIKTAISRYNYKYTKDPSIIRAIMEFGSTMRNVPMLFSANGLNYVLSDSRLKYLILLAIYTLSPFDLLPEAIIGPIGLLDDSVAVAGMIRQISSILYGFMREEVRRE